MTIIDELAPGRVLWLRKKRPKKEPIAYEKADGSTVETPVVALPVSTESVSTSAADTAIETTAEGSEEEVKPIVVPVVDSSKERRKVKIHTVAKGESLWGISRLYEVTMDDLLRWNELPNPDAISIGQNIQVKAPIEEASEGRSILIHKVQPKDTVYGISRKYNMTVDEVVDLNGLQNFDLEIGQELKVFEEK